MKIVAATFIVFLLALIFISPAHATTWTVTSTADDGSGGTLRWAISEASAGDTIVFDPTVFASPQTIVETQGTIDINETLTIEGPAAGVTISGNSAYTDFTLAANPRDPGQYVTLSNLTVENSAANGAGIAYTTGTDYLVLDDCTIMACAIGIDGLGALGTLTMTDCVLSTCSGGAVNEVEMDAVTMVGCLIENNQDGGGIDATGSNLYAYGCTFFDNTVATTPGVPPPNFNADGGGLYAGFSQYGTVYVYGCTFEDNAATEGGGCYVDQGDFVSCTFDGNTAASGGALSMSGSCSVTNCTFVNNAATGPTSTGGAIATNGFGSITNSTFTGNSADSGGAVWLNLSFVFLNDIMYGDTETDSELVWNTNPITNVTYCDIEGGFSGNGNIDQDPQLGALADNGGLVETCALGVDSPCWGAGSATGAPPDDARGVGRPNPPSIGAYDYGVSPLGTIPAPTFSPSSGDVVNGQAVTISDSLAGAQFYYTTDGSQPNITSNLYSAPIDVTASETINAIADGVPGYYDSPVGSATYIVAPAAATPTILPSIPTFVTSTTVSLADGTSGASIYYTTDDTTPSPGQGTTLQYTAPFEVSATTTVNAIAVAGGYAPSAGASATYTQVAGYEGDVLGQGEVSLQGWVDVGRIVVGLVPQPTGLSYQEADCSPRSTLGSGLPIGLAIGCRSADTWLGLTH